MTKQPEYPSLPFLLAQRPPHYRRLDVVLLQSVKIKAETPELGMTRPSVMWSDPEGPGAPAKGVP